MSSFGMELVWRFLGEKKSQWYEQAVAYRLTQDRFIAEKAETIFILVSVIAMLFVLAGVVMYLLVRRNILAQMKKECYYLQIFGYTKLQVSRILFLDAAIDLLVSLVVVLPVRFVLWNRFQEVEVVQSLMLLTESGTEPKSFSTLIIYLGISLLALIQISIRKEREKNGYNRRSKKSSKNI